jgi:cytochrome oxidase Cu insertion factor (SCO1/SenC/PrrC family)
LKNLFICLAGILISCSAFSQTDSTETPVYLRFPTIPQFTVYKAPDSTAFSRSQLNKKENTIFMIFSPDCSHCQHETEMLLKNINQFKNTQIVMVTYLPWEDVMAFYKVYKLASYPQITIARDTRFFFPVFFKVTNLPSLFVYDKKGKFVKSFEGDVKPATILAVL